MNHVFCKCYFRNRNWKICKRIGHLKKFIIIIKKTNVQPKSSHVSNFKNHKNYGKSNLFVKNKRFSIDKVNRPNNFLYLKI